MSSFRNIIDGIKEGDKRLTLWASDVTTMNDPTEMKYGLKKTKDFIAKWEDKNNISEDKRLALFFDCFPEDEFDYPNMYVVSCSADSNSSALWERYGDHQKGVNIHIKNDDAAFPKHFSYPLYGAGFVDVIYGEICENSLIGIELIDYYRNYLHALTSTPRSEECRYRFKKAILRDMLLIGTNGVKNDYCAFENEVRIVAFSQKATSQRIKDGKNVPYVEVQIPFSCITGFTIGALNQDAVEPLKELLVSKGFDLNSSPVVAADTPFM